MTRRRNPGVGQSVGDVADGAVAACTDDKIKLFCDGLGLVPAGTGNLLARNLDLPLEEVEAIEVALGGQIRLIDLVRIIVDDRAPEHFAVMAGIGIDAMIMDETNDDLKDKVGSAAYFVAAAKALGRLPVRLVLRVINDFTV
jgi:diacylglycerol kinase (ATP)